MPKATLSVVLITKNEAENLAPCLQGVAWADEIVVLDSGSTDETREIARRFTDKVYLDAQWQGFGVQRQRAQKKAKGDWIFVVDADERVTPELQQEICAILESDDRHTVYAIPRLSWAFGSYIRHSGWYPDYVVRMYPRERAGYDDAVVHEKVVFGKEMRVVRLHGNLLHYTFRDLEHWVKKTAHYATAWGERKQALGRRGSVGSALGHALGSFCTTYFLRRGFLDGRAGLILAVLGAYSRFLKYIDLWLRQQPLPPKD
jgi:(heptosyl)LPS beta-1,4-glucosyltransferase